MVGSLYTVQQRIRGPGVMKVGQDWNPVLMVRSNAVPSCHWGFAAPLA